MCGLPFFVGCSTSADIEIDQSVQGLYDADLSTDGRYSLVASIHHGASLWRTEDGERLYNWNHTPGTYSQLDFVALAGNGSVGLTAMRRDLVAWSSKDGKPIEFWQLPDKISCLNINETGTHAIVGMDSGQAMVVDIHNQGFIWKGNLSEQVTACTFDSTNTHLALGTAAGQVLLYTIKKTKNKEADSALKIPKSTWTLTADLELTHPYAVNHVNILTTPTRLLSGSRHHEFWITDIASKETLHTIPLRNASVSHSLLSGEVLLLAYTSRHVEFLDTNLWKTIQKVVVPKRNIWKASGVYLTAIAYKRNQLVATGSDGITHIYQNMALKSSPE